MHALHIYITPAAGALPLSCTHSLICCLISCHVIAQVCELLGLAADEGARPEWALIFSGAAPLPGTKPYAACYGGHQFGQWAGQLGDGRAITLGEVRCDEMR